MVTLSWLLLGLGFVSGACIGSFVNLVVARVPNGMSIVSPPSQCPQCGRRIRAYDNVPILGWVWLRGRCRDCKTRIPAKYILAELGFGLFGVAVANAIVFHGHVMVVQAEIGAAVAITLLALLPPVLAGVRTQHRDDEAIRVVGHQEGVHLHEGGESVHDSDVRVDAG